MKNKVAISHGDKFLIVDEACTRGICLKQSGVVVHVNGFIYIVYRGKEYLDSVAIEKLLHEREDEVLEVITHLI